MAHQITTRQANSPNIFEFQNAPLEAPQSIAVSWLPGLASNAKHRADVILWSSCCIDGPAFNRKGTITMTDEDALLELADMLAERGHAEDACVDVEEDGDDALLALASAVSDDECPAQPPSVTPSARSTHPLPTNADPPVAPPRHTAATVHLGAAGESMPIPDYPVSCNHTSSRESNI